MKPILLLPLLLLTACGLPPVGNPHVPEPAKPVDLSRYLGIWYEIGRYENSFEKNCEAVTAEYGKSEDGLITVVNSCHKTDTGAPERIEGHAKPVEGSQNAKLKVSFFGPFYFGNYWVLDHADDYRWSIVGEPTGRYLWLLTRSPHPPQKLKAKLWRRAQKLGYDTDLLHPTKQP